MKHQNLNLARRPFVNQRPVVRVTIFLWVLGGLLLLADVALYWSFYQGQGETRVRLAEIQAAAAREEDRIRELEGQIAALDLTAQNEQVGFLNERIEQRTFGWSVLFDTLAELLPPDVRLTSLTPEVESDRRASRAGGAAAAPAADRRVTLSIRGQAKTNEDFYQFLDALLASPAFRAVNPRQESSVNTGFVSFDLTTTYLPEAASRAILERSPEVPAEPEAEDAVAPDAQEEVDVTGAAPVTGGPA